MQDTLLSDIADRLKFDHGFKLAKEGKHLRKGTCPDCREKSLWTWADSPWVIKCERINNCGYEAHAKELYPDLFESWSDRFQKPQESLPEAERNPNAAADAYLTKARGFSLDLVKGLYTQEHYYDVMADGGRGAGSATVRFAVAQTWWERIIDKPQRFGKKKANFKLGGSYAGHWWAMPSLSFAAPNPADPADAPKPPKELWLVEGIFDAIALAHHSIAAVSLLSCNNYPELALAELRALLKRQGGSVPEPTLVWALDGDKAGRDFTVKHVKRAREDSWEVKAAHIPQRGKKKRDWNDLHQTGGLEEKQIKEYLYHGALLIAATAQDKALLIYNHTDKADFDLVHGNKLYWFRLDLERYRKAAEQLDQDIDAGNKPPMSDEDKRNTAIAESGTLQPIANCSPQCLYYQANQVTGEAWYYFRIGFPGSRPAVKGTFTAGQLTAASEFKKQLLHFAPGAMFSGSSTQLEKIMQRQLENPKVIDTVDFIGYSAPHKAYILGKVAVAGGQTLEVNDEDYFDIDQLSIKSLQKSIRLDINTNREAYDRSWFGHLWNAFGAKGYVALAYWFGSLFAEQIRAEQQSFPFLEIVGEPGAGKTTLIQFLWKLCGRDYEGFDPSKSTAAGRLRTFTQVSNLPIVLIESDRETKTGNQAHVKSFDWDELKDAYNGNSIRTTGVKTGGNETYDPPFRASIVISQNNQVQASQAIMERICHMTFDTKGFTPVSYESAKTLEKFEFEKVSGFLLMALRREADVMKVVTGKTDGHIQWLLEQDGVHKPRIAKNHAQLLSLCIALRPQTPLTDAQFEQVRDQVVAMARERQQAINADHPLVQEFWEAFDYLDSMLVAGNAGANKPVLNHSRDEELIAVNLNEFVERAATYRQQIPAMAELKKVLRTSKTRRFVDIKTVNSGIHTRKGKDEGKFLGAEVARTVHCWVFERQSRRKA